MYKNLAAMLLAACCVLPAFFVSPAFSQTQAPATAPLEIGFVCVVPVLALNFLAQGVSEKLGRQAPATL